MKKLLIVLVALGLLVSCFGALLGYVFLAGDSGSEIARADAPRAEIAQAPVEVVPPALVADSSLATTAAAEPETGRNEVPAEEVVSQVGDWELDDSRWVDGEVELPGGVPLDPTLRVVALRYEFVPQLLYGRRGAATQLGREEGAPHRDAILATAKVASDGRFRLPFPPDVERGWVALDGRFLYSERCTPVDLSVPDAAIALDVVMGAYVTGQVVLPDGMEAPDKLFEEMTAEFGPDEEQFSMFDLSSGWLFERRASVDRDGRFEFRAVPPGRSFVAKVEGEDFAAWKSDPVAPGAGTTTRLEARVLAGATITGRVAGEDGEPLVGAKVIARARGVFGFPGRKFADTETDAEGRFELEHLPPHPLMIIAEAEGFLESAPTSMELAEDSVRENVDFELGSGAALAGLVTWFDGDPVVGAEVDVSFDPQSLMGMAAFNAARGAEGSAETDAEGRFTVTGLGKGPFLVRITAERETEDGGEESGYAEQSPVKPGTTNLSFILPLLPTLAGEVVNQDGAPLTVFRIRASNEGIAVFGGGEVREEQFDDEDGRFLLDHLKPGKWEVIADGDGFGASAPFEVELPRAADAPPITITLHPAAVVEGLVLDPLDEPLAGARVTLLVESGKAIADVLGKLDLPEAYSGPDGRFRLEGLSSGSLSLVANHADFSRSEPTLVDPESGELIEELVLKVRRGGLLTGEVYEDSGDPLVGARVMVQDATTFETIMAQTDVEGRFRVERVRPGQYRITSMGSGFDAAEMADPENEDAGNIMEHIRFTMAEVKDAEETHVVLGAPPENPLRLTGSVRHLDEPVSGAMISFVPDGAAGLESMKFQSTKKDGTFSLVLDQPGDYLVTVQVLESDGMRQNSIEFSETIPDGAEHELDVELPVGRISGRIVDGDGRGIAQARATLNTTGGVAYGTLMGGQYGETTTDENGYFVFEYLRPGTYSVAAGGSFLGGAFGTHSTDGRVVRSGLVVAKGRHVENVDFELTEAGEIKGIVLGPDGAPHGGASVFVRDSYGNLLEAFSMTTTGADGRFRYTGVAPGTYTVSARTTSFASTDSEPLRVKSGAVANSSLTLQAGTILLVSVIDRSGAEVRTTVSVRDSKGRQVNGMVGYAEIMESFGAGYSSSQQRVGPLPPGRYEIEAVARDGRSSRKPVTVSGQAERRVKLRLK